MKNLKNKGAAMISVLVATVFIAIIATTLLYMAYLNYLTKAVRNASNDNFYTCEYALDDLATSLQQIAAETNSPSDAISKLRLNCVGVAGNSSGRYDNAKVTSLIKLASQVADITVSSNAPATDDNFIVSGNSITLKNLIITADSKNDDDPYHSTISTDLTLTFNTSTDGGMDVNDFSVITDDQIVWTEGTCGGTYNSQGGRCVMTGNVFVRSQGWLDAHVTYDALGKGTLDTYNTSDNDYTNLDRNAIICGVVSGTATKMSVMQLTGDRGIVVGNIVVGSGGVLTITGDFTVLGNIYVINGGVLLCSSNLKCYGKVKVDSSSALGGVNSASDLVSASMNTAYLIDKDKAGTGITANLFDNFQIVYNTSSGYAWAEFTAALEEKWHDDHGHVCTYGYESPSSLGYFMHTLQRAEGYQDGIKWSKTDPLGSSVQVCFSSSNPLNSLSNPTLLFNVWPKDGGYNGLVIKQSLNETTTLSIGRLYCDDWQQGIDISHMSDDNYETAKNILVPQIYGNADSFKNLYNATFVGGGNASGLAASGYSGFASGTLSGDMQPIIDAWNSGTHPSGTCVKSYVSGTLKTETRYAVWKDGKIYLPVNYLIRPDAGEFITQVFNSLSSAGSPTNTNVVYANWKKNDF